MTAQEAPAAAKKEVNVESRNQLVALVMQGIREIGLSVSCQEECCIQVEGIKAAPAASLLIEDAATVRWEYNPSDLGGEDPKCAADIVTALLGDGEAPYERLGTGCEKESLSFKGVVGDELDARGFNVELAIHEDYLYFDVWADISVTSESQKCMRVLVGDEGFIIFDADYEAGAQAIADDIKARIRRLTHV